MTTLTELERRVAELEHRVSELTSGGQAQQRLNTRIFEILHELREDVAVLRQHSIAVGRKIEEIGGRIDSLEARIDRLQARFDRLESRFDKLDKDFTTFRRELPAMIADVMREVLRESRA